jgi:outer membrane protein assembly factor BamD
MDGDGGFLRPAAERRAHHCAPPHLRPAFHAVEAGTRGAGARVDPFEVKVSLLRNSRTRTALVVGCAALALAACAGKQKKPRLAYEERPVELLYATGADRLDRGLWNQAVQYFGEVERQHPYSEWSRRAILMTAYAHYQGNDYAEAIGDADRFISLYPGNPAAAYAHYLKAICYFEQIVDVGRDQAATGQALSNLTEIVQRYPRTEYAADARLKIDMVNDQLAGKEMTIGRYYLRQGDTLAAVGRFKTVIDRYQTTSHTPEALYRLVESYLTLGLIEEAKRNGAVLGYNYPGDAWYRDAYKLLTDKGLRPAVEPHREERRSLVSRLPFVKDKDATIKPPAGDQGPAPAAETAAPTLQAPPAEAEKPAAEEAKPAPKKKRGLLSRIPGLGGDDK